jgi:hypothetical protein
LPSVRTVIDLARNWLTAYSEPVDHAVTDEDMAAGRGEYRAVCNAEFLPD